MAGDAGARIGAASTGWLVGDWPLPIGLALDRAYTLEFTLVQGTATVDIDDVAWESASGPSFIRGDCNQDLGLDVSDAVAFLDAYFVGAGPVDCEAACDTNADGALDIADPVFALQYLFSGGPAPTTPFPGCGTDATTTLSCASAACP